MEQTESAHNGTIREDEFVCSVQFTGIERVVENVHRPIYNGMQQKQKINFTGLGSICEYSHQLFIPGYFWFHQVFSFQQFQSSRKMLKQTYIIAQLTTTCTSVVFTVILDVNI